MTLQAIIIAWVMSIALAVGVTWHYTDKHARVKFERFRAEVVAQQKVEHEKDVANAKIALNTLRGLERRDLDYERGLAATRRTTETLLAELRRSDVDLPPLARWVFNASVRDPAELARANERDASPSAATQGTSVKLSVLLETVRDNNEEHWRCYNALRDWQDFWPKAKALCEGKQDEQNSTDRRLVPGAP